MTQVSTVMLSSKIQKSCKKGANTSIIMPSWIISSIFGMFLGISTVKLYKTFFSFFFLKNIFILFFTANHYSVQVKNISRRIMKALCIFSVFPLLLFSFFLHNRVHRERFTPQGDRNHSALVSRSMTTV